MRNRWLASIAVLLPLATGCLSGDLSVGDSDSWTVIETDTETNGNTTPPTGNNGNNGVVPGNNGMTTPPVETGGPETTGPLCAAGEMDCGGVCVDVAADDANCGACGNACSDATFCMESECVCETGELCGDTCVDTATSFEHCGTCDNRCSGGEACIGSTCTAVTEVEGVLAATNAARAAGADCGSEGVFGPAPALEGDPDLHEAAQVHADDMAANNFFSHTGSDGSSFSQRIGRTNFSGQPVGENIAAGQRSPQGVVDSWLDSDGHCRNMMNPSATKIGIGYALGGPYGTLWVQVFAR